MDDNKLSKLLSNALEMKRKQKIEGNAERVIKVVQEEWEEDLIYIEKNGVI